MKLFNWFTSKSTDSKAKFSIISDQEWGTYAKAYDSVLGDCANIAGQSIQEYASSRGLIQNTEFGAPKFAWISTPFTQFSFQHICFRYMSDVYSIIIAIHGFIGSNGKIKDSVVVPEHLYKQLLAESEKNNLIPCILPISTATKRPMFDGSHLLHAITQEPISIEPKESSDQVQMSEWEINNMGVNIVSDYLEKHGCTVVAFCDRVGISPQLWFEKDGKRSYVLVRTIPVGKQQETYFVNKRMLANNAGFDGYFAEVILSSSSPVLLDDKGNIVPLSQRFGEKNIWLWRGDGFYISFKGLQELNIAMSENSNIELVD